MNLNSWLIKQFEELVNTLNEHFNGLIDVSGYGLITSDWILIDAQSELLTDGEMSEVEVEDAGQKLMVKNCTYVVQIKPPREFHIFVSDPEHMKKVIEAIKKYVTNSAPKPDVKTILLEIDHYLDILHGAITRGDEDMIVKMKDKLLNLHKEAVEAGLF